MSMSAGAPLALLQVDVQAFLLAPVGAGDDKGATSLPELLNLLLVLL